ncbi:MAG: hypothetical protein IJL74_00645 [Bacilli bacterium]|nr:hypothetical protein [Bacilli bacterium]
MNVFEFILYLIMTLLAFFTILVMVVVKSDYGKLNEENKKLKEDLHKARKRKMEKGE